MASPVLFENPFGERVATIAYGTNKADRFKNPSQLKIQIECPISAQMFYPLDFAQKAELSMRVIL
ncbi:MAG: hypothetical protein Fur006_16640 [Coleofasciculaceae cyanobacterium]